MPTIEPYNKALKAYISANESATIAGIDAARTKEGNEKDAKKEKWIAEEAANATAYKAFKTASDAYLKQKEIFDKALNAFNI